MMKNIKNFLLIYFFACILIVSCVSAEKTKSVEQSSRMAGEYIERGILFALRGEYGMAIQEFTEAIKLDEKNSPAYVLRGRALFASASYVTSVGEGFGNVNTTITTRMTVSTERQTLYAMSIDDFTQAIRIEPDSAQLYRERGVAYSDKGDQNNAIADLGKAIQLSPDYVQAYNNRGNIYRRMREYDRAIADYNRAIEMEPDFARAYMNRGGTYRDKGDYNRAITDHTQAIRLAPDYAVAYNERAVDYQYMDDYDSAIADYTQSIGLDPNHPVTYGNRGNAYMEIGDYDSAIADYEAGLRLDPDNAVLKNNLEYLRLLVRFTIFE